MQCSQRLPVPAAGASAASGPTPLQRRQPSRAHLRVLLLDALRGSADVDPAVTAYLLAAARPCVSAPEPGSDRAPAMRSMRACGEYGDSWIKRSPSPASMFSVRLCAAAGQESGFSLQRARSGRERLDIISAAHAKLRPVGVSDPTAPRRSVDVGVEASLDCASAHAPGVPESSGVIARTATVEHPLVATSSPARMAGARVPGDYAKAPSGRSCAEQRRRGRRWPRCT